jgi:hypothetical protein
MPRPRVTVRGASTSSRPSPIENHPNPRAIECAVSAACVSIFRFHDMSFSLFMASGLPSRSRLPCRGRFCTWRGRPRGPRDASPRTTGRSVLPRSGVTGRRSSD